MRIAYCTNVRLPSERAHGHQVAQVCDALSTLGHDVTIFAPYRKNILQKDFWTYYNLAKSIHLQYLGKFDSIASPLLPGVLGLFIMNWMLRRGIHRALQHGSFDMLYTRAPALLPAMLGTGIPTILELHQLPRRNRANFVRRARGCSLIVALTSPIRDALCVWGIPPERIVVEGDGVDLGRFKAAMDKEEAWKSLCKTFPSIISVHKEGRLVVGYVGRLRTLGMEKGVEIILQALKELDPEHAYVGLIVGGPENDVAAYRARAANLQLAEKDVFFTGEIPASQIPSTLAACDVLVMPFPDYPHYRLHMSPLKMFEYMAAARPIITSDLPTIRDVLSEETAVFCKPGDVQSFIEALQFIRHHPGEANSRATRARELVGRYDWQERMKRILLAANA